MGTNTISSWCLIGFLLERGELEWGELERGELEWGELEWGELERGELIFLGLWDLEEFL
jgi:hypothetical protein